MLFSSPASARIEIKGRPELREHLRSAMRGSMLEPELHDTACQLACYLGTTAFPDRCLYGNIYSPLGQKTVTFSEAIELAFDEFREHDLLPKPGLFGGRKQKRIWFPFVSRLVWLSVYTDGE